MTTFIAILCILCAIVVLVLAFFGLFVVAGWFSERRYKIPEDSIWYIEETIEDLRDYYRTVNNPEKQINALNIVWEQMQVLKGENPKATTLSSLSKTCGSKVCGIRSVCNFKVGDNCPMYVPKKETDKP
jgi:hypothetical protein